MKISHGNIYNEITSEIQKEKLLVNSNGTIKEYPIRKIDKNTYLIGYNNKFLKAYIASENTNKYVFINGKSFDFKVVDEDLIDYNSTLSSGNSEIIKAPMPGSVTKVIVSIGDNLNEGDPVIIIEAMKMETTLYSTISGKVKEIHVVEGQQIDSDIQLALIEKEE